MAGKVTFRRSALRRAWIGGALFLLGTLVGAGAGLVGTERAGTGAEAEPEPVSVPRPAGRPGGGDAAGSMPVVL